MIKIENTVVYLIGFPGVGKLTVAQALCARTGAKLVDNHLINNPIFSVIGADGVTPIPEPAWESVRAIRKIVLDAIVRFSPPSFSFVLTNVLLDHANDRAVFDHVAAVAEARSARLVPVILDCEEEEMMRRLISADRKERLKMTNADFARQRLGERLLLPIDHENLLRLDTTRLPVDASANAIITHIAALA